jgi:hypothetical protein
MASHLARSPTPGPIRSSLVARCAVPVAEPQIGSELPDSWEEHSMKRSRLAAAFAAVTLAALVIPATVSSAAPGDAVLTIVHGLGPAPNAVDVYVDGALTITDFQYEEQQTAELPGGTYTIEICGAVPAPPDPLPDTGCEISANFPNGGVDVTVADNVNYTVVAQYAGAGGAVGRPTVAAYVNDLSCVEAGLGRVAFINAATVVEEIVSDDQSVDVFFDDDLAFVDVVGQSPPETDDLAPTTFEMEVRSNVDELSLLTSDIQSPLGFNFTMIFVGNPQQDAPYDLLSINYAIEDCVVPTTTTAPTTTTVPPAVTPVVVTPVFTG